ncbi:hypothetical protein D3C72_1895690 [compost metagenome]
MGKRPSFQISWFQPLPTTQLRSGCARAKSPTACTAAGSEDEPYNITPLAIVPKPNT